MYEGFLLDKDNRNKRNWYMCETLCRNPEVVLVRRYWYDSSGADHKWYFAFLHLK